MMQLTKCLLLCLMVSITLLAAVGDNAPPVPASYVQTHPRLPKPDNAFLNSIWANWNTGAVRYKNAADAWDSTSPGSIIDFRRLLIAYLASSLNNGPNTALYLQKIQDMRLLSGMWAARQYYITDGVAAGTSCVSPSNCTITTSAGNFLAGCGGGTCLNKDLGLNAYVYSIVAITPDGLTATIQSATSPAPSGSGLTATVINPGGHPGSWTPALALAIAYDWIYANLGTATQTSFRNSLLSLMTQFEAVYDAAGTAPSAYNDQFYITGYKQMPHIIAAVAVYPDDAPNSLPHLRFAMDVWLNTLIPVWKQIIGGGYCGASNDASSDCGGGWHESWEYVNQIMGLKSWYVPTLLSWATATNNMPGFFTVDQPWIKNFAYWTMYQVKPDFNMEKLGAVSRPYFTNEYDGSTGAYLGSLDGLAAIYNDATLRGWSRLVNWGNSTPDGFEPSAWPFYPPDSAAKSTNTRAALAKVKNFPGWGKIFFRTGWTEDDTFCSLSYGDDWWSHPVQDAGGITCYNRGSLLLRSGTYRPGSNSRHFQQYALQAIAQNTILIYDPNDLYTSETYTTALSTGAVVNEPMPNDGGQRRTGSGFQVGGLSTPMNAPYDPAQWLRNREYYHKGKLVGYAIGSGNSYAYAAVDITAAYNNLWSRNAHTSNHVAREANTSNRSFRARKVVRHFVFIPRGTSAYVVVYDQVASANSTFVKKNILHFVNQPTVISHAYTAERNELVTSKPYPGLWPQKWAAQLAYDPSSSAYQYAGKLYGWMTLPAGGSVATVGGAGHEFDITDSRGTTNYNECGKYGGSVQCATTEGLGAVEGFVNPESDAGPNEPGSYRIEQSPSESAVEDWFLNVMLMTTTGEDNVVSTMPETTVSDANYVTTWKDNGNTCTYTVTLPKYGVGGTITATGTGCAAVIN